MVFEVGSVERYHLRARDICKTSGPHPAPAESKLHTNKFSRSYERTLKCEKHWTREDVALRGKEGRSDYFTLVKESLRESHGRDGKGCWRSA